MSTIRAKLLTYREETGGYILYVFEDLDAKTWDKKYRITLRFPNWEAPLIKIGDIGYLNFREVVAGRDVWWDRNTQSEKFYNYSNSLFENFIHEKPPESSDLVL